jgi:hypothetical protein
MRGLGTQLGTAGALPLALIAQAIPRLSRTDLEILTERLIDELDLRAGDSDIEPNGDERDGSMAEDDFHQQGENWRMYPGCPLADPGEPDDGI